MGYRESHIAPEKGETYSGSFQDYSYRRMIWEWEQKKLLEVVNTHFVETAQIRYLDFACGTGRVLGFLERQNKIQEAFGVDVSKSMLNVAQKNLIRSSIIFGDITRENIFPAESFDLVTTFRFFLNAEWELKIEAMKSLSILLRSGGGMVFNIHMQTGCFEDRLLRLYSKILGRTVSYNSMSIPEVTELVNRENLEIVAIYHYGVVPVLNEKKTFLPFHLFQYLENYFSKLPSMERNSRHLIFFCRKKEGFVGK